MHRGRMVKKMSDIWREIILNYFRIWKHVICPLRFIHELNECEEKLILNFEDWENFIEITLDFDTRNMSFRYIDKWGKIKC